MKDQKPNGNLINLNFSVTGKTATIEKVNVNQPLQVSVQKAIEETGTARPVEDYDVLFNNTVLDISQKVETLNLSDGALLMVSLKSGKGGKQY